MEAIFMGAITWAIIGICYMIYSEFCGIYADIYHSRKCDAIRVILVSA